MDPYCIWSWCGWGRARSQCQCVQCTCKWPMPASPQVWIWWQVLRHTFYRKNIQIMSNKIVGKKGISLPNVIVMVVLSVCNNKLASRWTGSTCRCWWKWTERRTESSSWVACTERVRVASKRHRITRPGQMPLRIQLKKIIFFRVI